MITRKMALTKLRMDSGEIARLYPGTASDYRGRPVDAASVLQYLEKERARFAEVIAMLPDPPHIGARLLDVGIAYGFLDVVLGEDEKWRCEGLETPENIPVYCAYAQACGIPVHAGKLGVKPLDFEPGSFQAILFSEVLEHLRLSPPLGFGEVNRLLAPGGWLLLTTPNMARLTHITQLLLGRNPCEPFPEGIVSENITEHLTHIREYTMGELTGLLERHGFAVRQTRYSDCMERGRPHGWITRCVPRWRGDLMVLAEKRP